jgi:hypothetical protein
MFAGEEDSVTRQSRAGTVENLANLSMLPWLADVGYGAGQAAANPKTRKRNLKDLSMAALLALPGTRKIRAYHGSPHKFDKFRLDKDVLRTGQGATSYGEGTYLAEAEPVARGIRDETAGSGGHMYEVDIHADPEEFLDWDRAINEQSPVVSRKLRDVVHPEWRTAETPVALNQGGFGMTPERTMAKIKAAGIPGIRYLDALSRRGEVSNLTRNYVVNNPDILEILRRYGIAGLLPALGVMNSLPTKKEEKQ